MSKLVSNRCLKSGFSTILTNCVKSVKLKLNYNYCQTFWLSSETNTKSDDNICVNSDTDVDKLLNDQKYEELIAKNWRSTTQRKDVLLVMPRQKWGQKQMAVNYAKYLMDETITLINTLPNMKVIDSVMISTLDIRSKFLFGSGNFKMLKKRVGSNPKINGVVFSLDMLNSIQTNELKSQLGVDIYDRYSIVLNIFRMQSNTKESKLQICLAEIPYIRNNLRALEREGQQPQINTSGKTWFESRKILLDEREIKLNKLLDKIQSNRELLRINRQRKQFPVIAIVGYTNSGKTALIKALTDDKRLVPRNQLFATLDVTVHAGRLPSGLKVLFTDTIGFISEIPTFLIHSFKSALSEICSADLIVHVLDVSHPNYRLHEQTVHKTLEEISVPEKLKDTIIEVNNKIDLISDVNTLSNDKLSISATERIGLNQLLVKIEEQLVENTGRLEKVLRVSNGGPQYQWLYKNGAIYESSVDPKDYNYLIIKIYLTNKAFQQFKHSFGNSFTELKA